LGYFEIPVVDEGSQSEIEEGIERPNSSGGWQTLRYSSEEGEPGPALMVLRLLVKQGMVDRRDCFGQACNMIRDLTMNLLT
jgi:hypothetical protein